MDKRVYMLLIATLTACVAPPQKVDYQRDGEVECLAYDTETIELRSRAVGGTDEEAIFHAEVKALENLFYKGIPNSNQETPLIPEERQTDAQRVWALEFFNSERYRNYISNSSMTESVRFEGRLYNEYRILFHLSALRRHLEKEGIIRKFGL